MSEGVSALAPPVPDVLKKPFAGAFGRGLGIVLFFVAYLILDKISYLDALRPFAAMAWNPALGICVAVAALWGRPALPLIFAAPLVAATLIRGFPLTPLYTVIVGALTVGKVVLIVWGGERVARSTSNGLLRSLQAALLIAAIPATLALDYANAAGLAFAGLLPSGKIIETTERLWIGDLIGIFVQMPFCFLVLGLARARFKVTWMWLTEVALQCLLVGGMVWFIFGVHRLEASDYFYLLFLPMIWIVLNHGLNGAIVLNMFVQASTISFLLMTGPANTDLIFFQALAIVLVASSLTLGLSVEQSRVATQRLRAREQEVATSLKIAATSELAGALAHELSHPIGAVSNYAVALTQMTARKPDADPEVSAIIAKLRQEARRATETVRRLREFFRSGSMAMEAVEAGDLARDTVALLTTRMSGRTITLRTDIESGAPVLVDRIQLLGVLHNLLLNAIEAVETVPAEHRTILIRVRRAGEVVRIAFADSGPGIAPDIRDHIFEALATTKSAGLGLGLSISRSIVQAHGGRIELGESELGGACFVIILPSETAEVKP